MPQKINHEKAYLLGLFVGNGTIANGTFIIKFPFKKWGMDPMKMNSIARDILTKISNKFYNNYGFHIAYEIGNEEWIVKPNKNTQIKEIENDLIYLGLPIAGFLLKSTDLSTAKIKLNGSNLENFLSGIFDTRGSLTKSHRRFTNKAPIVSLEIPGSTENFNFVKDICSWLTEQGTITDQILYNHPNQHSAANPNYSGWKKGFKIRFMVSSFLEKNTFALSAKAFDVGKLQITQGKDEQVTCLKRRIRTPSPVCIHKDMNSPSLPPMVRNKLFFHYFHYCAVLGCKFAPINEIKAIVKNYKNYIFALPRMEKGSYAEIKKEFIGLKEKYLKDNKISSSLWTVADAIEDSLLLNYLELEQGAAYLFSKELNGRRHVGKKEVILEHSRKELIKIYKIENTHLSPLMMVNEKNDRAVLVSAIQSGLNQKLVSKHVSVDGLIVSVS